jgi:hypothetical protein
VFEMLLVVMMKSFQLESCRYTFTRGQCYYLNDIFAKIGSKNIRNKRSVLKSIHMFIRASFFTVYVTFFSISCVEYGISYHNFYFLFTFS